MVCCAQAVATKPVARPPASKAVMHAPYVSFFAVVILISSPWPSRDRPRLRNRNFFAPPTPASGRRDAEATDERLRDRELAVDDLERERRQRPRGRPLDDGGGIARIRARVVAGTFQDALLG